MHNTVGHAGSVQSFSTDYGGRCTVCTPFRVGKICGGMAAKSPRPHFPQAKKGVSKHDRNQLQESFAGFPQIVAGSRSLMCTIASTGEKHCRNYAGVQSKLLVASPMGDEGTAEILAGQIRRATLFT